MFPTQRAISHFSFPVSAPVSEAGAQTNQWKPKDNEGLGSTDGDINRWAELRRAGTDEGRSRP